jgi:hypothetical protein
VLHAVEGYERPGTSESRLAVDRDASLLGLGSLQELVDDVVWGRGAVEEV